MDLLFRSFPFALPALGLTSRVVHKNNDGFTLVSFYATGCGMQTRIRAPLNIQLFFQYYLEEIFTSGYLKIFLRLSSADFSWKFSPRNFILLFKKKIGKWKKIPGYPWFRCTARSPVIFDELYFQMLYYIVFIKVWFGRNALDSLALWNSILHDNRITKQLQKSFLLRTSEPFFLYTCILCFHSLAFSHPLSFFQLFTFSLRIWNELKNCF